LHQALGARLEAHDETGQTLLMKAAARGDLPLVQALLAAGVAVLPTDIHGWSALEHAVQGRAPETALALIAAGARERIDHHENSTLQYAVNLEADPRVIAALVQAGAADVNRRSRDGLTVLMEAIDAGNPPASIEALLAAAALDPGLRDPAGEDALAHARARGDAVITEAVRVRLGTSSLY
jgi:ankyrin repeat protein